MSKSTNMEHVRVLQRMANESWHGSPELAALVAAIAALSAPQPPAEAQPVGGKLLSEGGAGCHDCDGYQAEGVFCPTCGTDHSEPPPSAPVGVEGLSADLETIWHSVSDDKETNAAYQRLKAALAQQPAAVDGAMVRKVAKAINAELEGDDNNVLAWQRLGSNERKLRDRMARAAIAALAAQQGGSDNDR